MYTNRKPSLMQTDLSHGAESIVEAKVVHAMVILKNSAKRLAVVVVASIIPGVGRALD